DWLGDRAAWGEILQGLAIDAAGGQKRRLGRFLFAMNGQHFCNQVQSLVAGLRNASRADPVTFHLFCGLAGGTGSGAIIDAIAQLRRLYPDANAARIMVYAYLPDMQPPRNWSTGNYHANAYAALKELNALGVGGYAPHDVVGGTGRLNSDFWYNGCYVYSDTNDQGYRAGIDADLPETVADFVFLKTVVARHVQWDDLQRFENSENGNAAPEATPGGKGQRSVRFLGFGIKRLAFPEETIRESLTYDFAAQSYRQLQFNNWVDGIGYLEQPRPQARAAYVADAKQQEDWRIADDHVQLNRLILDLPGTPPPPYPAEWEAWENQYVSLTLRETNKLNWAASLKEKFSTAWRENFRRTGVQQFFELAQRDEREMARDVRGRVERTLFSEWANGQRALFDCALTVSALIEDLAVRLQKVEGAIEVQTRTADDNARQIELIEKQWAKLRLVDFATNSRERDVRKLGLLHRSAWIARTRIEALRFSKALMPMIVTELSDLKTILDSNVATVSRGAEAAEAAVQARTPADDAGDATGGVVATITDAPAVRDARKVLVLDKKEQEAATAAVRARIIGALGPNESFGALADKLTTNDIRDIIVQTCEANVVSAHQRLIAERSRKVIGVSIIDKLRDIWADPEQLRREATALTRSAGRFVAFDNAQQVQDFPGKGGDVRGMESFAVIMPQPPEHRDFVTGLERALVAARPGGATIVPSAERSNEITLISLVNLFPLRFVRLVGDLRRSYEARLAKDPARGALEIHTEGDGSQFPNLFIADAVEIEAAVRPLLLLAEGMGLIRENRNHISGKTTLILAPPDADVMEAPLELGGDLMAAAANAGADLLDGLQVAVQRAWATGFRHIDNQAGARDIIRARLATILAARGNDPTDAIVTKWRDAAKTATTMLEEGIGQ
ncbi:MAG: hypothetical protein RL490_932, partial [Pseudomonadota bacterium]